MLVKNLVAAIMGSGQAGSYDGYTACPLVTGYGKLVMAEFGYDLDWSNLNVGRGNKTVMQALYWRAILKGAPELGSRTASQCRSA